MNTRTRQVLGLSVTLVLFVLAQVLPLRATTVNYGNAAFSTDAHFAYTVREQTGIAAPVSASSLHGWRTLAAALVIATLLAGLVLAVRRRSDQRPGAEILLAVSGASMLIGSSLFAVTTSPPEGWFSYVSYVPLEGEGTVIDGPASGYFCLIAATVAAVVVLVMAMFWISQWVPPPVDPTRRADPPPPPPGPV